MNFPFSRRRLLVRILGGFVALEALTAGALTLHSAYRKRRSPPAGFPHVELCEVGVDGNRVRPYGDGKRLFPDMLEAIDGARETILLETYIWHDDATGRLFKEHLIAKARQGVKVFVIFDSFGNLIVPRAFKRFPPEIQSLEFGLWRRPWALLDPRRYALDHRKILVVDGSAAFIGGFNLGDSYRNSWRDSHLRIIGPVAAWLGHEFVDFWNRFCRPGEEVPFNFHRGMSPRIAIRRNDTLRMLFPIRGMYVDAIERAEREVWITTAYFVPDRILTSALLDAARRGVDVKVLIPWESNHVVADWLARGLFAHLLDSGVRLYGYRDAMIHAKTMVVDGTWCTVGTANLDRLSQVGNFEIALEIWDRGLAEEMRKLFSSDLSNAFEVNREWWSRRPWYARGAESILVPLRPWL